MMETIYDAEGNEKYLLPSGNTDKALKSHFGLKPSDKWPENGLPPANWRLYGIDVWVKPLATARGFGVRKFELRAMCACPVCERVLPYGRLNQHHAKVHMEAYAIPVGTRVKFYSKEWGNYHEDVVVGNFISVSGRRKFPSVQFEDGTSAPVSSIREIVK